MGTVRGEIYVHEKKDVLQVRSQSARAEGGRGATDDEDTQVTKTGGPAIRKLAKVFIKKCIRLGLNKFHQFKVANQEQVFVNFPFSLGY